MPSMNPSRETTRKKYDKVHELFNTLHNKKRLRFDDCVTQIANTLFYKETFVIKILQCYTPTEKTSS